MDDGTTPPAQTQHSPDRASFGKLMRLGLPLVAGMGGHAFFNLVDLAMVGAWASTPAQTEAAISGVTIGSLLSTVPLIFMNGVTNGSVPIIGQAYAARKFKRANHAARQALLLSLLLSILLGVIPALFSSQLAAWFQPQTAEEMRHATEYLYAINMHAWTGFVLMQITSNMRAIGWGLWPMALLLLSNLGNVALNWVLIFGKLGFEAQGPVGAANATVFARLVSVVLGLVVLWYAHPAIRISLTGWKPRARMFWRVTASGLPVALQWTLRMFSVLFVLYLIADFGPAAKAAYGIGSRLDTLALFAGFGWGGACAALVGHSLARGEIRSARRYTAWAAVLNVLTMSIAGVAYWLFPEPLINVFSLGVDKVDLTQMLDQGTRYLRIGVLSYPGFALSVVWSHAFNGAGSVKTPLAIDAIGLLLLQIPLVWLMKESSLGIDGAWWGLVISHSLIASAYFLVFRHGAWERRTA